MYDNATKVGKVANLLNDISSQYVTMIKLDIDVHIHS